MGVLDGFDEGSVGFDGLFHGLDVALQQINALIHMLHLRRQPLHKRVVKRRSHIALPECSGTISKNRVGVGADEAVVDA